MKKLLLSIIIYSAISGCATNNVDVEKYNNQKTNASVAGVTTATLVTVATGGTGGVLFINSIIGGFVGHYVGDYLDNKEHENEIMLKVEEQNKITSVEQKINITFPSDITFPVDDYAITEIFEKTLVDFSNSLIKYDNYKMTIIGHTDNTGSEKYNLKLSLKRATAIKDVLIKNGILLENIKIIGKGELEPIEKNNTEIGRSTNRRVEIKLNITE